jgi:hypothetical protein
MEIRKKAAASLFLFTYTFVSGSLAVVRADEPAKTEAKDKVAEVKAGAKQTRLQGSVSETAKPSPFLYGSISEIPPGVKLKLAIMGNLNSQLSKPGDEVIARISYDVGSGEKVVLPGGWFIHGNVKEAVSQKRLGRDGYVKVEFDRLINPDGEIDLPFNAEFSTKDNELKSVAKTVLIDSGYVSLGALGGSILSVQLTGIPVAIATHGISVGAGAAVGGGLGLIGALKRKGKIASFFPGDELTIETAETITLPGFDPRFIPSAQKPQALAHLRLIINRYAFNKDPLGDKLSRQLNLSVTVNNESSKEISFFDLVVLSDAGDRFYPTLTPGMSALKTKAEPYNTVTAKMAFNVGGPKHKYWLVLLDHLKGIEIARSQIN